ncbi:oxidoreductase [Cesiribacter andamanensis]|uniref:NAD(P)-binding domain-containing protein n=1 Tax=Cesiribacter andamanensis AMV16 TaxID=1279009 RepID=M7NJY6_9BACT|nr:oxidoreductase [Cesiribacter andamanensis]EMR02100.1 hypothetical protein ADICEAN_02762 [Cesiribacter andamanensis AMV16]
MNTPSTQQTTPRTALVAGASGLVGKHLLELLLEDPRYGTVQVLTRRKLKKQHPRLEQLVVDFDALDQHAPFTGVQDVYCCLGTTMKKAGSKEVFRKVDYVYPLALARLAAQGGAEQYLLITAMGANKGSLFFYNRVKGEVEEAVSKIPNYKSIHIFRPSLLLGDRKEDRLGEDLAGRVTKLLRPLMVGPFRPYRPIKARDVARGMLHAAFSGSRGVVLHASEDIKKLARTNPKV